jgi:hypothetical protein
VLGIDTDPDWPNPDRYALDADHYPDPAKLCGSDLIRLRIRIHSTCIFLYDLLIHGSGTPHGVLIPCCLTLWSPNFSRYILSRSSVFRPKIVLEYGLWLWNFCFGILFQLLLALKRVTPIMCCALKFPAGTFEDIEQEQLTGT